MSVERLKHKTAHFKNVIAPETLKVPSECLLHCATLVFYHPVSSQGLYKTTLLLLFLDFSWIFRFPQNDTSGQITSLWLIPTSCAMFEKDCLQLVDILSTFCRRFVDCSQLLSTVVDTYKNRFGERVNDGTNVPSCFILLASLELSTVCVPNITSV